MRTGKFLDFFHYQGPAELFDVRQLFARTDQTQCLSERFGRTNPNRQVGRSLLMSGSMYWIEPFLNLFYWVSVVGLWTKILLGFLKAYKRHDGGKFTQNDACIVFWSVMFLVEVVIELDSLTWLNSKILNSTQLVFKLITQKLDELKQVEIREVCFLSYVMLGGHARRACSAATLGGHAQRPRSAVILGGHVLQWFACPRCHIC